VRRVFKAMLAALGLELDDARLYGLRHAHITELLDQILPLEDVSRRAGHSTAYFTDLVYNHPRREKDRALADALERRLSRRSASGGG
jgi:integrase